jgi:dethiobiotin synthetase
LRLGCISHSLLSLEAIRRDGLPVLGWVANAIDADYSHQDETIDTIENLSGAACLAHVPRAAQLDQDEFVASLKPVAASLLDDSPH